MFSSKLAFDVVTMQKVIQSIGKIDAFKGKWNNIENKSDRYLRELRKVATIESIGSSTRIEGAVLNDNEVQKLINNIKVTEFKSRDEEEVFGYYEALDIILNNAVSIQLSESYIKQLHTVLLKYSSKDQRHKGVYKNLPNSVVANYPDGNQRTIFNTTPPHLTQKEMQEMIDWVNQSLNESTVHLLLVIGLFVYEFLSIHPFQDGNGRLSRLLTTLLLLKSGYEFAQYISFEHIIEQRKKEYYQALMHDQSNRGTEKEIISEWILFFLTSLEILIEKLEIKYSSYKEKGNYINERQQQIQQYIETNQPVKLGDVAKANPHVSINTLKKDLQLLVQQQVLSKVGEKKGTVYIKRV
ncbi:MAG: Fic family protein [Bacteroidetes bacterium]|nr:Fic family protein [Bacteroidota bacterium]